MLALRSSLLLATALLALGCGEGADSKSDPADAGHPTRDAAAADALLPVTDAAADARPEVFDASAPDAAEPVDAGGGPDAETPDAEPVGPDAGPEILPDAAPPEPDAAAPPEPDAAPPEPDAAPDPRRCESWADLDGQPLLEGLHAHLHATYRPIAVEPDRGGTPNRYTTARRRMFVDVEWPLTEPGAPTGYTCLYTGAFVASPAEEPHVDTLNTEHVWPRSGLNRDRASLLYSHQQSDVHHLHPTLPGVNNLRGSFAFGEPVSDRDLSWLPSVLGRDARGATVFQPREAVRGDVARIMFYMTARWGLDLPGPEEAALRRWHAADPVDAREAERNDRVEAVQGNRNPFVDCPELVDAIADFAAFPSRDTAENLAAP